MISSIPYLYPPDAAPTELWQLKMFPDMDKCPTGRKIHPWLRTTSLQTNARIGSKVTGMMRWMHAEV